jgi:hypothetical protein
MILTNNPRSLNNEEDLEINTLMRMKNKNREVSVGEECTEEQGFSIKF